MKKTLPDAINAHSATADLELENRMVKWVRLPDDVHKRLTDVTSKSETYAQSITRLIEFWEKHHKGK